jgi:hypothetical protein
LLADGFAEFDAHRASDPAAISLGFPLQKCLDSIEVGDIEPRNVRGGGRAAVRVDRVNLDPQAVVPVRAARLRQPRADGDEEQDEQQQRNADGFEHAVHVA